MRKTALKIMLLTVIIKVLGFTKDITLSYFFGASNISDAYLVSITIPTVIFEFIGIGITTSYIPIYSTIKKNGNNKDTIKFTNDVINFILVFCTVVVVVSSIILVPIVKMLAPGFEGETLKIAVSFTRIALIGVYFSALVFVFNSYLQLHDNFVIPAFMGIPLNIFIVISIFIGWKINIIFLPIGTIIAIGLQMILTIPYVTKYDYKFGFTTDFYNVNIKKLITMTLPVIIGMCINQINVLVDKIFASSIIEGGISSLAYANKLILFIQGIFAFSVSTAIYPSISRMVVEKNINGLKESFLKAIGYINLLIIPATVGAMVLSEPIIRFLFGRGAFTEYAISITSKSLFFYSIGMIAFSNREILSKVFYSQQDIKIPTINALISLVLNIVLNVILSNTIGIGGLALATSISAIISTSLLFLSLKNKIGSFDIKFLTVSFVKVVIASIIMGIFVKYFYNYMVINSSLGVSLVLSIILGAVVYFLLVFLLKTEIKDSFILVKRKIRKTITNKIKQKEV